MHTLAKNQHHNTRLIDDFILKAYPGGLPTIRTLINDNIINGTQLLECAVSKVDGIPLCEVGDHRDLIDDSDVKTVTVVKTVDKRWRKLKSGKRKRYMQVRHRATIRGVHKKWGVLRIICWNPFLGEYCYFLIPPSAIYGQKNLAISFDNEHFLPTGRFAEFEVSNFDDMSRKLSVRDQVDTIVCNIDKDNIVSQIDRIMDLFDSSKNSEEIIYEEASKRLCEKATSQ